MNQEIKRATLQTRSSALTPVIGTVLIAKIMYTLSMSDPL